LGKPGFPKIKTVPLQTDAYSIPPFPADGKRFFQTARNLHTGAAMICNVFYFHVSFHFSLDSRAKPHIIIYNQVKGTEQNEALGKPNDERVLYALYLPCPRVPVSRNRRVVFVTVDRTPTGRSDLFYARIPRAAADNVLIGGAYAMPFVPRLSM
jgi:hypothetical protein